MNAQVVIQEWLDTAHAEARPVRSRAANWRMRERVRSMNSAF